MTRPTRRRVLGAAALLGVTGVAAACSNAAPAPPPPPAPPVPPAAPSASPPPPSPAAGTYTGDLQVAALGAALANLAADLYAEAVTDVGRSRYGIVPGVVVAFLQGAGGQHADAARAWNEVLAAGGRPAVTGTPLTVDADRRAALAAARAPTDLVSLALDLETSISATLVDRLAELTTAAAVAVAAGVAPVAAMHAATAAFLLGRTPGTPPGPDAAALGRAALTV